MDYEDALAQLTEEKRLCATVYAMNTLLIAKGVYTSAEFKIYFRQSAQKRFARKHVSAI